MKIAFVFILLVAAMASFREASAGQGDPLCRPLRGFVASVQPGEAREFVFHTRWGGDFNDSSGEPTIYAKRCIHSGYAPAKAVCAYLMDHGTVEFSGNNVKRALACLSSGTHLANQVGVNQGSFSLSYGTQKRGSLLTVEMKEDMDIGGMAMSVKAEGY
ncbi:MAG: hypothetical protein GXC76_05810 [Rhodanobacteraceae bacterium]|jgi:hypothetical protein|nr:hypothetical protein [Rhodanobacteraceae bacterium]